MDLHPGQGRYDTHFVLNLTSLPPRIVGYLIKGIAALLLGLLALVQNQDSRSERFAIARGSCTCGTDDAVCLGAELEAPLRNCPDSVQLPSGGILFVACRSAISNAPYWFLGAVICPDGGHLDGSWWFVCRGTRARDRAGIWIVSVGRSRALCHGRVEGLDTSQRSFVAGRSCESCFSHLQVTFCGRPITSASRQILRKISVLS